MSGRIVAFVVLTACAARSPSPVLAAAEGQVVLEGVVRYTPLPPTMSVEAWLSQDITLMGEGKQWDLTGSAEVPDEVITSFAGQRVRVLAVEVPEHPPEAWEAAPMGLDGPMPRPATWRVVGITPAR